MPLPAYHQYETPPELHATLLDLSKTSPGLNAGYGGYAPEIQQIRNQFFALRDRLAQDALAYFATVTPVVRPALPTLPPEGTLQQGLATLLDHADGIALGETHWSVWSKKILMDHAEELLTHGVRTLYLEHLFSEVHQADLDQPGPLTPQLAESLDRLDRGHHTDPTRQFNFRQLVETFRNSGIKVVAIDCLASYYLKGLYAPSDSMRETLFSYFAGQVIRHYQSRPGSGKWVALVGNAHSNRFRGVPGLAELCGGIGLRLDDHATIQPWRLEADGATIIVDNHFDHDGTLLQNDFIVRDPAPRTEAEFDRRLTAGQTTGAFLFWRLPNGQVELRHYPGSGAVVVTPILHDDSGIYIQAPCWKTIDNTRYATLYALRYALTRNQMRDVTHFATKMDLPALLAPASNAQPVESGSEPAWVEYDLNERFQRKKDALLMQLSLFASPEERAAFRRGKTDSEAELLKLNLSAADSLNTLKRALLTHNDSLSLAAKGALLQAIHQRQARALSERINSWRFMASMHDDVEIRLIPHNLFLAASEQPQGVCVALAAHLAAAWQADLGSPGHTDGFLNKLSAAIAEPAQPSSRLLALGLQEWSIRDPAHDYARFGDHPTQIHLSSAEVERVLDNARTPAMFELSAGHHAILVGAWDEHGTRYYGLADPNYGQIRFRTGFLGMLDFQLHRWPGNTPAPGSLSLRQYRADLGQQRLFLKSSGRASGPADLCLAHTGQPESLAERFNQNQPLENDRFFARLVKRLTLASFRAQVLDGNPTLPGAPVSALLKEILSRVYVAPEPAKASRNERGLMRAISGKDPELRLLGIDFEGADARIRLQTAPASTHEIRVNGAQAPDQVRLLREYQALMQKMAADTSIYRIARRSFSRLFGRAPHLDFDTLYLASALSEADIAPQALPDTLREAARATAAETPRLPAEEYTPIVEHSLQRLEAHRLAARFQQAVHALIPETQRARWLPVLASLQTEPDGRVSLEFIDRQQPETTVRHASSDPALLDAKTFLEQKIARMRQGFSVSERTVQPRASLTEAEAVDGLNSAFALQALIGYFAGQQREAAGDADAGPTLRLALQVHEYLNLTQLGQGVLQDGLQVGQLWQTLASEAPLVSGSGLLSGLSTLGRGAGALMNLANVILDGIELGEAQTASQKALFGTRLAFDSAGLALAGAALLVGEVGALAAPLAGLGLGATALAKVFSEIREQADSVARYFGELDDNHAARGLEYLPDQHLLKPRQHVVIVALDLRAGVVRFGSPLIYANRWDGWRSTPDMLHERAHAIDIRAQFGRAARMPLPDGAGTASTVQLPFTPASYISYSHYGLYAGSWTSHAYGFAVADKLRRPDAKGDVFDFRVFPFFEYALQAISHEYVPTPVQITLDARNRTLLMSEPLQDARHCLRYALTGANACYTLVLRAGATLSLHCDAEDPRQTEWRLDASALSGDARIARSGPGLTLSLGELEITIPDPARVGRVHLLAADGAWRALDPEQGEFGPLELDAGNWLDQNAGLQQWLGRHTQTGQYLIVDGYRVPQPDGSGKTLARAWYDVRRQRYLYLDDTPGYHEASLIGQAGAGLYFYSNPARRKILRVDAASHRVAAIFHAPQAGGEAPLRLRQDGAGLSLSHGNDAGGEQVYQLVADRLLLTAIHRCPTLLDSLGSSVGPIKKWLQTGGIRLARSTLGHSRGGRIIPTGYAPWVALDAPLDQNRKRAAWLRSRDGLALTAPDVAADLQLAASDMLADGSEVFYFYSASEQKLYRQAGATSPARVVDLPGLSGISLVDGMLYLHHQGCISHIDAAGRLTLTAVQQAWLAQHPAWWRELAALPHPGATVSVLDVKIADGQRALPVWFSAGQLVVAAPALATRSQLLGLNADPASAWLFDPQSHTLWRQPLLASAELDQAFDGARLKPEAVVPAPQDGAPLASLALLGASLTLELSQAIALPCIQGIDQLVLAASVAIPRLALDAARWRHYPRIVIAPASAPFGLELTPPNPLALQACRQGDDLHLFDRAGGTTLVLKDAIRAEQASQAGLSIRQPDGGWLTLNRLLATLAQFEAPDELADMA